MRLIQAGCEEPTSGHEPLSCSLRVITQALQGCAGACKFRISKRFFFSGLLGVAPYCVPGGIRVVSISPFPGHCEPPRTTLREATEAPRKVAAAAWFAPLPPLWVESSALVTVSPGFGRRSTFRTKSWFIDPGTKTSTNFGPYSRNCETFSLVTSFTSTGIFFGTDLPSMIFMAFWTPREPILSGCWATVAFIFPL
jgi:hypothetical protein